MWVLEETDSRTVSWMFTLTTSSGSTLVFFTFEATKSISISLGWTFVVESPSSSRCMNTAYKCSVGRLKSISNAGFYGRRALRDGWHRTQNQGDVRRIFVTFDKQAAATWDVFVHAGRDQWHTTKLSLSCILTHAHPHTHTQACTHILPHTRLSLLLPLCMCVCVRPIKPHWWKNSRLAVFPDWVALDMHTSKALQVDVPALKCCNSLAWLTQNTFGGAETKSRFYPTLHLNHWWSREREKNKKTESYVVHCEWYFACVSVSLPKDVGRVYVFCWEERVSVWAPTLTVNLSYYHLHYLKLR